MLIVMTTTPDMAEAERLAEILVEKRLAACVQILPEMRSYYRWQGEVKREPENLMLIKTATDKWEAVRDAITAVHSYDVPEIVAIEAEHVASPCLAWLKDAVENAERLNADR